MIFAPFMRQTKEYRGRGCGLVDRAADPGPCDPSSIPLGEKKENKRKEAGVGPFKKKGVQGARSHI